MKSTLKFSSSTILSTYTAFLCSPKVFTIYMHTKYFVLEKCFGNKQVPKNNSDIGFSLDEPLNAFEFSICQIIDLEYLMETVILYLISMQ